MIGFCFTKDSNSFVSGRNMLVSLGGDIFLLFGNSKGERAS